MANAQQIEFLNDGINVDGSPLSGGTIYFYGAGGLIAKEAYRDAAKTDAVESVTTGTDGRPQDGAGDATAMYGEGNYRIVVKDADAVTVLDIDNVYYALSTATSNVVTVVPSTGDPVTATTSDEIILVTTGANAINVNLPAAATSGLKKTIKKVDAGGGTVVINKAGSDTIQGAASFTLSIHNQSVELIADGANTWEQAGSTFFDSDITTDVIHERTAAAGVTIDGFLIKDTSPDPTVWPAFAAYINDNQGFEATGPLIIEYGFEIFDTNSNYNASTYKFTPTVAGLYHIGASIEFIGVADASLKIYKNGSLYLSSGPVGLNPKISTVLQMNGTTDYVAMYADSPADNDYSNTSGSTAGQFYGCRIG